MGLGAIFVTFWEEGIKHVNNKDKKKTPQSEKSAVKATTRAVEIVQECALPASDYIYFNFTYCLLNILGSMIILVALHVMCPPQYYQERKTFEVVSFRQTNDVT